MSLPTTNEPLTLADGTVINPSNGKPVSEASNMFIEIPSEKKSQQLIAKTRRTVADLPAPTSKTNAMAVIVFYSLYGFNDEQTAIAIDSNITTVKRAKESKVYKDLLSAAQESFVASAEDEVRSLIQQNAVAAASKVIEHARGDNDVLSFKASQDILDRAGHRPVDKVAIDVQNTQTLNIVYTKADTDDNIVEADFKELEDVSSN